MADSETSRTLPAISRRKEELERGTSEYLPHVIDRRNLLSVTVRLLSARTAELRGRQRESGPTPVYEMWPRWHACQQQRIRATRRRQKLEAEVLEVAGGMPVVQIHIVGNDRPTAVRSLAEINRMTSQLDAEQLSQARAELRQRRKQWKKADRHLGYSAAVALEQELAQRAGVSGRVMGITRPSSLTEVTAKLHCLIVMHDPRLKLEDPPWPELRTMLKDLTRLVGTQSRKVAV